MLKIEVSDLVSFNWSRKCKISSKVVVFVVQGKLINELLFLSFKTAQEIKFYS